MFSGNISAVLVNDSKASLNALLITNSFLKFEKPQILLNDIHGEILGFLNMSRTNDFKIGRAHV